MSAYSFSPKRGPVLVKAEATGPSGTINLILALDTAATQSGSNLRTCFIWASIQVSLFSVLA
jgi:hypothetical protein